MPCEAPGRVAAAGRSRAEGGCMYYVYLLRSISHSGKTYIGMTENVDERLRSHNEGDGVYTRKYRPWVVAAFVAVKSKQQARTLERYFKTGSGHAFARKRLWS